MRNYKCLSQNVFEFENYQLVPIRYIDMFFIMKWRNEQMYHLRQNELLTSEKQKLYFDNVISSLFDKDKPDQILFSYLYNGMCIGYGGLVHINWIDKNAEISFIMNTELEKENFSKNWTIFLSLLEKMAFKILKLFKIYVYAFDLRTHLYKVLEENNYFHDATLSNHCFFQNKFINVVIYSKINL